MPRILVVDDSATDRSLVAGLLQKEPRWEVEYAEDGSEAVARLERSPVDLVVTDLLMPKMTGLELVAAVRSRFPAVPVVLMTSQGSEEIVVRALRDGAASYVPKRLLARRLRATVSQVLAVSAQRQCRERLLGSMSRHRCSFVLGNDCSLLEPLVAYLQEMAGQLGVCDGAQCTRVGVALQEALANAFQHGNLEIDSESRGEPAEAYCDLIARRCRESPYAGRRLFVEADLTPEQAVFVVRDEGVGFDPSKVPNPLDPDGLERCSGRGLLLMRAFMDEIRFNASGNSVTLVKRRAPPAESVQPDAADGPEHV